MWSVSRRRGVDEIDGRVIGGRESIRGVLRDPRQALVASCEEIVELRQLPCPVSLETEGMAAVAAVGRPLLHLHRVERGLRAGDGGAPESGGLPRHGVGTLRVRHVGMERQPQAGARPRRAEKEAVGSTTKKPAVWQIRIIVLLRDLMDT